MAVPFAILVIYGQGAAMSAIDRGKMARKWQQALPIAVALHRFCWPPSIVLSISCCRMSNLSLAMSPLTGMGIAEQD